MKQITVLIIVTFLTFQFCYSQYQISIGLLTTKTFQDDQKEVVAAFDFLKSQDQYNPTKIYIEDISTIDSIENFDIIWFHHNDPSYSIQNSETLDLINQYLQEGGKMLLTLDAFRSVNDLGIEPNSVETKNKEAADGGYGRKLGLHAFRGHPVFDGLNGGSYIYKPQGDTTLRICGYFDENTPLNGAVVAVDWDYIFIRENAKLAVEYWTGKGKVLAIGAYTVLSESNTNSRHLELFLNNCLDYLYKENPVSPVHHWQYYPQEVIPFESDHFEVIERISEPWEIKQNDFAIIRDNATKNYCETAGERILIMGKETGGIDEIWSHPFMAFRDYEAGIKFSNKDSIIWLNKQTPQIEIRPESFTRKYSIQNGSLTETIIASKTETVGVIHYQYIGDEPCEFFIKFKSNMRLMWPYSEKVFKTLRYAHDINLNSIIVSEESEDYACLMGSNKEPENLLVGQYEDFKISWTENNYCQIKEITSDDFLVSGIWHFQLFPREEFDIVVCANHTPDGSSAINTTIDIYKKSINNTALINEEALTHNQDLFSESLIITTPDSTFNKGYKWALEATDRFFVNTPGLGGSLVAGYNTTNTGWDGGHKIDGRPGYAWYFGRDGQWSGFALLDYGDIEKVKSILKMYQDFQDLNGKIYHEISTSGVVHYDAADATPLYIILAGKYLKHSGDVEFIRESWPNIKKAIEFCFSTDTDGDHLIENTNVGHGWVEGGHLFGSHSSLYLTSCWAAALDEASYITEALELNEKMNYYQEEAEIVKKIISTDFWDDEENYYYQGKYIDGTYHTAQSIMPSIPMYFEQTEKNKAIEILPAFAEYNFTSDWGCRIVSADSPNFHPRGYHTGSVWPLFTGWVSLAEFNYGQDVQGYTHIMNNLQVFQHWSLGYIEEVLHGEIYQPAGVCRHQCWSETMVLQPAIEGMLGFEPDAVNNSLTLSPKFPVNWDSVKVKNIKVGDHIVNFTMNRNDNLIRYQFQHSGSSTIKLHFDPLLPEGTEIKEIIVKGNFEPKRLSTNIPPTFYLNDLIILEYKVEKGIKVIPSIPHPQPGDTSKGIRIVRDWLENDVYNISVEALQGSNHILKVYINDWHLKKVINGNLLSKEENIYKIEVNFTASENKYQDQIIKLTLE